MKVCEVLGFRLDIYGPDGEKVFDILCDGDCYGALNETQTMAIWKLAVRLQERVDELREYAKHQDYCSQVANGLDGDCQCGLLKALEASR